MGKQLNTTTIMVHPTSKDTKTEPESIKGAVKDGKTGTAKTEPRR